MTGSTENDLWKGVLGLALLILGLFIIFFVKLLPLTIGVIVAIIGVVLVIYYLLKPVIRSLKLLKNRKLLLEKFRKNYAIVLSIVVLLLILVSFVGASTFDDGTISISPNSRKLVIYAHDESQPITEKGPFTVDSVFENETDSIRMPYFARDTLGVSENDTIDINNHKYTISQTRDGEPYILRLPIAVKNVLNVSDGDIIRNSQLADLFNSSVVSHNQTLDNNGSVLEKFVISASGKSPVTIEILIDGESVYKSDYLLKSGDSYNIAVNGTVCKVTFNDTDFDNSFDCNGHNVTIKLSKSDSNPVKMLFNSQKGNGISLIF